MYMYYLVHNTKFLNLFIKVRINSHGSTFLYLFLDLFSGFLAAIQLSVSL